MAHDQIMVVRDIMGQQIPFDQHLKQLFGSIQSNPHDALCCGVLSTHVYMLTLCK